MRLSTISACLTAMLLLSSLRFGEALEANELTFATIRDTWNAAGQFTLQLATGNLNSPTFTPVKCPSAELGACTATNPPLMQDSGDLLRITYTMVPKGANGTIFNTVDNQEPTEVQFRICYSPVSFTDRAWRKKNKPYPRLSQNCPRKAATYAFNGSATSPDIAANTGVAYWNLNNEDEIPTSTWFVMAWVYCGDKVCAFSSTEGRTDVTPTVPGNFLETAVELGITPGMRAAAIILSIIGPVSFFAFWAADSVYYKRTGKTIRLG